ncbi:hemerythrin domain-containing protein [Algoriphagus sp. CAU 1675]|uniref:hemerythrin domain-containing protein n=1 Tax=Algoriphagus sp. CAU 1675 TaxID=3032597 RepID=UPI0023DCD774|nr:hemerythrin domain-containing protein [Algoriphagus sp. CAU 1675]MDF2157042.1 hemerythrin domain-containing protein [Algoriphagus sp. CAU 1675]
MRMNTYAFPHKALRTLLGKVSIAAGNADPSFPESLQSLKFLFKELYDFLEEHAQVEDQVILPALEMRMPGSTLENHEEHEYLDAQIGTLSKQLEALNAESSMLEVNNFYLDFSNFQAEYLKHMLLEEQDILEKIWMNFSDEELMEQHQRILASFTPDQIMATFKYIIPSLTYSERRMAMGGLRANAPEFFYLQVLKVVKAQMNESDFDKMVAELEMPIEK